jgi:aspartyl-tRNA(Asn)/glutamyl-tRNA(Gln) amidotransferase subunit A
MAPLDALLTPTMPIPPPVVETIDQATTPALYTRWVNFYDLCGVAVPNGFTADGLPVSLQVVCRGFEEAMALRIGWAYQAAHDWHLRVPAMAA